MIKYRYGLILGVVLAIAITLSNIIFPDNASDSSPQLLITALAIGFYVIWASSRLKNETKRQSIITGAVTSLIGFSIAMVTFALIDNLFLATVSHQADKIWGFQHSTYSSMRVYVNMGLLRGILIGIPGSIVFGIVCGWLAHHISTSMPYKLKKS